MILNGCGKQLLWAILSALGRAFLKSVFILAPQADLEAVEKWESCFWISTFPPLPSSLLLLPVFSPGFSTPPIQSRLWKCGNLAVFARFPRAVERVGNLPLVFQAFHRPAFP